MTVRKRARILVSVLATSAPPALAVETATPEPEPDTVADGGVNVGLAGDEQYVSVRSYRFVLDRSLLRERLARQRHVRAQAGASSSVTVTGKAAGEGGTVRRSVSVSGGGTSASVRARASGKNASVSGSVSSSTGRDHR